MATNTRTAPAPLTFDLPVELIAKIEPCRRKRGLKSVSEVIRLALDSYDFDTCNPERELHRQLSVRISPRQRATLKRYARQKDVSVGELLRLALEDLIAASANKTGKRR